MLYTWICCPHKNRLNWLHSVKHYFQDYYIYVMSASAPTCAFLEFTLPGLCTIFYSSYRLLSHITIADTMVSTDREINSLPNKSRLLMTLDKKPFENIVRKGENAAKQHFLLFPQCFLPILKRISVVKLHVCCHLQMLWIWTDLKICRLGKR